MTRILTALPRASRRWHAAVQTIRASCTQRFAGHAHIAPLVQEFGAHGAIEVDGRGVPVEDLPLQAQAALFDGNGGDPLQQRLADAEAAKFRLNEQVFEVEARAAQPGGVVEEVEGKPSRQRRQYSAIRQK